MPSRSSTDSSAFSRQRLFVRPGSVLNMPLRSTVRAVPTRGWSSRELKFAETGRVWAATLVCSGNAADAAEIYAQIGGAGEEAAARLLGAEQFIAAGRRPEADAQLQKALAFYSRAGAARIVAQAEALLAAAS